MSHSVAFLGLGLMGGPMAKRLLDDYDVTVWTRNQEKLKEFHAQNSKAKIAHKPEDAIANSKTVIVMLFDGQSVRDVILSEQSRNFLKDRVIVQMSTVGSHDSIQLAKDISSHGGHLLGVFVPMVNMTITECPVLGTTPAAVSGTLQLLVTGPKDILEQNRVLLERLGSIRYLSDSYGKSSVFKLALNQMIGAQLASFAVSGALLQSHDLPVDIFTEIVRGSAFHSKYFDFKFGKMINRDFSDATFAAVTLGKDVALIEQELQSSHLETASVSGVRKVCDNATDFGVGDKDVSGSSFEVIFDDISPN